MMSREGAAWKVSLHGGHSGAYCDHASGTLRETLEAAVSAGYRTIGVSEHAPRLGQHLLYEEEVAMGWDVPRLESNFETYARDVQALSDEFDGQITVLRGFESEVAPKAGYRKIMLGLRDRFDFEYMVGSVHHVDEVLIDGPPELFARALQEQGGLEALAVAYYRAVAEMIEALKPEVVGHFDLIRKNAPPTESVATPVILKAAEEALEAARAHACILDLNTAGYRKGLGGPYPAPRLLRRAHEMGLPFCFGDDSHAPDQVGAGIEEARGYLLEHGVESITVLTREEGAVAKKEISLVE